MVPQIKALLEKTKSSRLWIYLGPAFVASVAYMDPGNFATNIVAGSYFGYALLWVIFWSNIMAILIQYLSAKLGIVTGKTLPENCRDTLPKPFVIILWLAAEAAALATDLAEFLGAALGFYLLFKIPLLVAALMTAIAVFAILAIEKLGFRKLEYAILSFVAIIGISYAIEVFLAKPDWSEVARGVAIPTIHSDSIYVAVGIVGATVMPHVIYLHSALVQHRRKSYLQKHKDHIHFERFDILAAMNSAFLINAAMIIMAAAVFFGSGIRVEGIEQAHETLKPLLGGLASTVFAIALLASGLSSSTVGTMAGQVILEGFMNFKMSIFMRRFLTMLPAIIVIALGLNPLGILVLSQVILSFALPFAIIPLLWLTGNKRIMGEHTNRRHTQLAGWVIAIGIIALNLLLLYQTFGA